MRLSLLVLQPQTVPATDDEWELWCYSNWQGRRCPISVFSTKNSTWATSQLTPGLCGEHPVTKHLKFGMSVETCKWSLKTAWFIRKQNKIAVQIDITIFCCFEERICDQLFCMIDNNTHWNRSSAQRMIIWNPFSWNCLVWLGDLLGQIIHKCYRNAALPEILRKIRPNI